MKKVVTLSSITLTALLTACSGGPSDGDINDALVKGIEQQLKSMPKNMGMSIEIESVENVECGESDSNYKCTYDVTSITSNKMQKEPVENTVTTTSIFADRDGEWVIVQ